MHALHVEPFLEKRQPLRGLGLLDDELADGARLPKAKKEQEEDGGREYEIRT